MLIVTTNGIPGYRIEAVLGEVMGMTVRSAALGSNITAGLRSLGGGELPELTKVVYESRNEVMSRMWGECSRRGGNAIIGMRFDTGELGKGFTEVCAYGTAVVVTPIGENEPGATPQSIARAAAENPGPGNWPRMDQGTVPLPFAPSGPAPTGSTGPMSPGPVPPGAPGPMSPMGPGPLSSGGSTSPAGAGPMSPGGPFSPGTPETGTSGPSDWPPAPRG